MQQNIRDDYFNLHNIAVQSPETNKQMMGLCPKNHGAHRSSYVGPSWKGPT